MDTAKNKLGQNGCYEQKQEVGASKTPYYVQEMYTLKIYNYYY